MAFESNQACLRNAPHAIIDYKGISYVYGLKGAIKINLPNVWGWSVIKEVLEKIPFMEETL